MNVLLKRGPEVDEEFWELLEETLILSDIGAQASFEIVENLRDQATRKALPDAYAVLNLLVDTVADTFTQAPENIFENLPQVVMFVGVNGSGKTTTVGKIAAEYKNAGKKVLMGGADTFRAAAMEQLEVWSQRADVEIVTRDRGSDPASVCYETIERSEELGSELVLIDTSGRLHTSNDLMRELQKIVKVVRKRSQVPVQTILVIDATTGQNGLQQAREFNKALELDGIIVTKLDGTAKGGIALAISHELHLPIFKIGVGEQVEDLQDFDPREFTRALLGNFAASEDLDMSRVGVVEKQEEAAADSSAEKQQDVTEKTVAEAAMDKVESKPCEGEEETLQEQAAETEPGSDFKAVEQKSDKVAADKAEDSATQAETAEAKTGGVAADSAAGKTSEAAQEDKSEASQTAQSEAAQAAKPEEKENKSLKRRFARFFK
ncbi:MAG: signal recognition particle-docking protein FtsY [Anaerotardibacter sp.]